MALFQRTKKLETRIDEFLDKVVEAGLLFKRAVDVYLQTGASDEFNSYLDKIIVVESRCDELRRRVQMELYSNALIPDARGDVLELLEDIDNIVNLIEANLFRFSIQSPKIDEQFNKDFNDLTTMVINATESLVMAARAFFRDFKNVRDFNNKVLFYESEADIISTKLQRSVFNSDLELDLKRHLTYFVEKIDELANAAEDIADKLTIFAIKRKL